MNDNEKSKKLSRKYKVFYSLTLIALLCCVLGIVNTIAHTDNIYGFDYDQREVREVLCDIVTLVYTEKPNIVNSPHAVAVSYSEVLDFVELDKTDETEYELDVFDCTQFSETLHDNAEAYGIEAGVVTVFYEDKCIGHAINVFNTTDCGLIFVDNTGYDSIVKELKIGSPVIYGHPHGYDPRNVESFTIYW